MKCFFLPKRWFVTLVCCVLYSSNLFAAIKVTDISIEGNHRIESETILSNISFNVGEEISQLDLDVAVKKLFNTGYFADVNVAFIGNDVIIKVVENPIVNRIAFEGNDELEDKILKEIISLRTRQVYTLTKLKADTKTLHDVYRLKGYFAAKVTPKIIRRDQNRVDIIFEIEEGQSTKVQKIAFVGNKAFSESKLEEIIQTKESRWYRFFTSDDTYDPDRLAYDKEILRRFYLINGYADFRVKSAVAELTPDQKEFFITFTIEEGERYKFGKLNISSAIATVDAADLEGLLTVKEGDWYSSKELDLTIEALTAKLGEEGYAFVDVRPKTDKNADNKTIDLNFEIVEGPRVYIDRIIITGNIRTDEDVIRRELLIFEGDAFNSHRINMSERRLRNLGFFKKVKITQTPSDAPDRVNLIVKLDEEESTGELWIAAGYSTLDGIVGDIGIRERNLLGRGQDVKTKFSLSSKRKSVDFGFTEPYFMDRRLRAGFDIFHSDSRRLFNSAFSHERTGVNLRIGYNITEYLTQGWAYTIRNDRITSVNAGISKFIREQKGNATTSMVSHNLLYDRRDSVRDPTRGYYTGMTNQFAGVGGNVRYFKNDLYGGYFIPVADEWVLGFSGSVGAMDGLGKTVRIVDRYSMGDIGSLRGFRASGAEPRDILTGDALGGLRYYLGTAELVFPLGLPSEIAVKGAAFTDIGAAWHPEEPSSAVFDTADPRVSIGAGLTWRSPMGPLRIDFAKAVKKEKFDRTKTIHFGFSTRF